MTLYSSGSLESVMAKSQGSYGGGNNQLDNLQSMMKSQFDLVDDDEPTSVLELSQCISPPLQPDVWVLQQQQRAAAVAEYEQQQAQLLQQEIFQHQQMLQWQQTHQLWEQQQAEIAQLQYLQDAGRHHSCVTGFESPYMVDPHHLLQPNWEVNYDPYQSHVVDDTMIQSLHSDPWVDFQQQENVFGSQLMQGLPCLEDPLILESWMTSGSGDSSLTSTSTEVDSSQSFLTTDEHESLRSNSNKQHQQQQHQQQQQQQQISRCPSASSAASTPEVAQMVDKPVDDHYEIRAMENFNSNASPMCVDTQSSMEDIKPSSNWFRPGVQDTIGPPIQQLPPSPSPMTSSPGYQQKRRSMTRNPSPISKFQMSIPGSDSMARHDHHQMPNKVGFMSAHPAISIPEMKPSSRMSETPSPLSSGPKSMGAPAAAEAITKPVAKLYGPVRPSSHSLGAGECVYSRPLSEPAVSGRRSDATANQKSDASHMGGQRTGSNDHNASSRGNSMGGAGRVVTLAELASGGVKMGGVQLPIVGTQIPSVVRLAVETQASGMGGVRMVQVLLACAEAVACRDSRQANILLQQLQHMASPYGDAMQRITACFVEGLSARLAITGSQPFKFTNPPRKPPSNADKREGFNLVYQSSPYVAFGHFAANTAILEAFEGEERMHIVDLGMTHSLQWPYLIHGLAKRPSGPPKLLRITGFGLPEESMKEAGEELSKVAAEAKVPFEFRAVAGPLEELQRSRLELREGEALAVNSVLQLHCVVKESRGSLNAVLQSIHELSPKILTLVEQDASHNGPFFLGRFMEALHYYSAIFDSLDAILPRNSDQRVKMEQFHFADEIKNIVSCEGPARVERHERVDQWRRRMSRAGFQPLPLKFLNPARLWLGLYSCEGYTLSEEKGCLVLGWKGKPIIAASSWKR